MKIFGKELTVKVDKMTVLKWGLIGGGGLMALVGEMIDRKIKDNAYRERMGKEIQEQAKRILGDGKNA